MKKAGSYFDNQGNLIIPPNIPGLKELDPPLTLSQYRFWIFLTAKDKRNDFPKDIENYGSRSTRWRIIKELVAKEYF